MTTLRLCGRCGHPPSERECELPLRRVKYNAGTRCFRERLRRTAEARERVELRLAAILAADVAAYSRLIGADEEGSLARPAP